MNAPFEKKFHGPWNQNMAAAFPGMGGASLVGPQYDGGQWQEAYGATYQKPELLRSAKTKAATDERENRHGYGASQLQNFHRRRRTS